MAENVKNEQTTDIATEVEQDDAATVETTDTTEATRVAEPSSGGGFLSGAVAAVSAALGFSSLTGTPLSEMLRSRAEITGQIKASTGGGGNPVESLYGTPWHVAALVNGGVALVAVLVGALVLALHAARPDTQSWVKSLALAGVLLGVIGLLVSAGMALDLFAGQPQMPSAPGMGG